MYSAAINDEQSILCINSWGTTKREVLVKHKDTISITTINLKYIINPTQTINTDLCMSKYGVARIIEKYDYKKSLVSTFITAIDAVKEAVVKNEFFEVTKEAAKKKIVRTDQSETLLINMLHTHKLCLSAIGIISLWLMRELTLDSIYEYTKSENMEPRDYVPSTQFSDAKPTIMRFNLNSAGSTNALLQNKSSINVLKKRLKKWGIKSVETWIARTLIRILKPLEIIDIEDKDENEKIFELRLNSEVNVAQVRDFIICMPRHAYDRDDIRLIVNAFEIHVIQIRYTSKQQQRLNVIISGYIRINYYSNNPNSW